METINRMQEPLVQPSKESPTGWLVTFRYHAPELTRCGVIGDWLFSDAAHSSDAHSENRMPHEWRQGDFPYKTMGMVKKKNDNDENIASGKPVKLDAKSIGLDPAQFLLGMYDMEKDEASGDFTLTIPLPSGTFLYQFVTEIPEDVFQSRMATDPENPPFCFREGEQRHSTVTIPNSPVCEDREIELPAPEAVRGRLEFFRYAGKDGTEQVATVYLPHGYTTEKKYPALYLSHGGNGHHSDWVHQGKADHMLDRMIAAGTTEPMVVVMMENEVFRWQMEEKVIPNLRDALIPAIERAYSVDPARRAYAGLSMGGILGACLYLRHTDLFGWYGIFSGANMEKLPYPARESWPPVFVGFGEYETAFNDAQRSFIRELQANGVTPSWQTYPGGHQWQVWRKCLVEFAEKHLWKE